MSGDWHFESDAALLRTESGTPALLDMLVQDGLAESTEAGIRLPYQAIADLEPWGLAELGLPPAAPFRLEVRGTGNISSPQFRIHWALRDGRSRLAGISRTGTLLEAGRARYTLLNPLFELAEALESFKAAEGPQALDQRFALWASIKRMLPDDAIVDDQLQLTNFVRADGFTLNVHADGNFDPVPLSRPLLRNGEIDDSLPEEPLPEAHQESFFDRFKRLPGARGHYALGNGWYVAVPESTRRALEVVHRTQKAPRSEREAFIANPQAVLRDALAGSVDEDRLEAIFVETPQFLSDRVQCLGIWHPRLAAYLKEITTDWLPDESAFGTEIGVQVGGSIVRLEANDAPELVGRLREAIESGAESVDWNGQIIPADDVSLAKFERLVRPERSRNQDHDVPEHADSDGKLVPILYNNFEELDYVAPARPAHVSPGGYPDRLATRTLYQHQQEGLEWLQRSWTSGSAGVLLADDMGLGKTLQTLAFLAWVKEEMERGTVASKPMLVVAPTGLLKNWEAEADTHLKTPGLGRLLRAYGADLRSLASLGTRQRVREIEACDWVMTTYETLRDRIEVFLPIDWAVVAFDEVQKVKNPGSRMTEMAKAVKSDFTVALTGTPVENSLSDLWSIMDLCRPGLLGSLSGFREEYQKPAENEADVGQSRALRTKLEEEVSPPSILRRMKEDHLQGLPEKIVHRYEEPMTQIQADAYSAIVSGAIESKRMGRGSVLEALQGLRRVSLMGASLSDAGLSEETIAESARLRATLRILDDIREKGEKALIFVEYLDVQDALAIFLQRHYGLARPPMKISGKVSGALRQKHVNAFQANSPDEFDVMLLSPKAGGVGLTLTAANHVIHVSRWWNPAVEDQCTDRIYRIGQQRDVRVHYPLAIHPALGERSFDVNLDKLLERKRALSYSVLAPPSVSEQELASLFDMSAGGI